MTSNPAPMFDASVAQSSSHVEADAAGRIAGDLAFTTLPNSTVEVRIAAYEEAYHSSYNVAYEAAYSLYCRRQV